MIMNFYRLTEHSDLHKDKVGVFYMRPSSIESIIFIDGKYCVVEQTCNVDYVVTQNECDRIVNELNMIRIHTNEESFDNSRRFINPEKIDSLFEINDTIGSSYVTMKSGRKLFITIEDCENIKKYKA